MQSLLYGFIVSVMEENPQSELKIHTDNTTMNQTQENQIKSLRTEEDKKRI